MRPSTLPMAIMKATSTSTAILSGPARLSSVHALASRDDGLRAVGAHVPRRRRPSCLVAASPAGRVRVPRCLWRIRLREPYLVLRQPPAGQRWRVGQDEEAEEAQGDGS